MKKKLLPYVLQNAIFYNGKANLGSILGKILGENPDFRKDVNSVKNEIEELIKEVNKLSLEDQKKKLEKIKPEFLIKKKKKKERILPELIGAEKGKVVMRIAPNPNGPLHIGHCRMAILNDEYVKKYKGKLILRFDDTDPKNENKLPMKEAYKWIEEDLNWLGIKYDKVERASSRLDIYYKHFETLLDLGAYICFCEQEKWSKLVRRQRKECPCRKFNYNENLENWKKMLAGKFKEGGAVARILTDIEKEKNPAVLDWVAFRIIDNPKHPFSKNKVWPTLDFASAIDDNLMGVTHIIRGKDLASSEEKQRIFYKYMGWSYPETKVYGKFITTDDMIISKRRVLDGIKRGIYSGYDDPKLVFLRALRRRGIQPESIRKYILNLGLKESETTVDLKILHAENRKILDPRVNRYMVVLNPHKIVVDHDLKKIYIDRHPENKKAGRKNVRLSKNIFISGSDWERMKGKEVRLKELFNLKLENKTKKSGDEIIQKMQKIQWVSEPNVKVEITYHDRIKKGLGEPELNKLKIGNIIQMERIGFGVIEGGNPLKIIFSHK